MTVDEIIAAYRRHWTTRSLGDFDVWEAVDELCRDLKKGCDITLRLINSADDDPYLAYIAAGPLEDLIKRHGAPAVRFFELPAENSDKVRRALAGVWITPASEAFDEWMRLMTKFGYAKKRQNDKQPSSLNRPRGKGRAR